MSGRWWSLTLLVTLMVALGGSTLAANSPALASGDQPPAPLRLAFRLVARGASDLQIGGRYLSFTQTISIKQRTVERFRLFDDRAGKRIVTPRRCAAGVLGDHWIGLNCSSDLLDQAYEAFNLRTRKLRSLPCVGLCQQDYYSQNLVAVGARWFQVEVEPHEPCGDGIHTACGPTTYAFYDVRTGRHKVPIVTKSETVDLNSPTLVRTLCVPLTQPAGYSPTIATANSLTFDGSFAIAQESSGLYIERCGSDLHVPLVTAPFAGSVLQNARAIAFCSFGDTATNGLVVPSLTPFTIVASAGAPAACPLLGPRHAYILDAQNQLWAATLPPPLRTAKPPETRTHAPRSRPVDKRKTLRFGVVSDVRSSPRWAASASGGSGRTRLRLVGSSWR